MFSNNKYVNKFYSIVSSSIQTNNVTSTNCISTNVYTDHIYELRRLGINNNNPAFTLDVNGNINFTGKIYQDGKPFSVGSGYWNLVGNDIINANNGAVIIDTWMNMTNNSYINFDLNSFGFKIQNGTSNPYTISTGEFATLRGINTDTTIQNQLTYINAITANISSNTSIGGKLSVGGNTTLSGYVGINSNPFNTYNLTVGGTENITGLLTVDSIVLTSSNPTYTSNSVVPKSYVDTIASGIVLLAPSACATTSSTDTSSWIYNGTNQFTNVPTSLIIDGYTVLDSDRVLVQNQSNQIQNGVYVYNQSDGTLTRAQDLAYGSNASNVTTFIQNGLVNKKTSFLQTNYEAITGVDNLIFHPFQTSDFNINNTLQFVGNTLGVNPNLTLTTLETTGNTTVDGDLHVNGTSTLVGLVTADEGLNVINGITTDTIIVTGETDFNNITTNSLTVINNETVGGTLSVTGNTTLSTVSTSGLATLNSVSVTNNENVGGTLSVTGNTTLSTVSTSGLATLNSVSITNNETVGGTLGVTGITTLTGQLIANGGIQASTITTTSDSTFNGVKVGRGNNSGTTNINIGDSGLSLNTSGTNNIAVGNLTLSGNTAGTCNTSIGYGSMYSNTTGNSNTAIGQDSLNSNTIGNYNTAVGLSSLQNITTGSSNTAIGQNAGYTINSGSNNTFLGANSDVTNSAITYNQSTAIGYNAKITDDHQIVLGTSTETVFIPGNTSLSGTLDVSGGSTLSTVSVESNTSIGGKLSVTGNTTLSGYVGINSNPNNTYNLIVNGTENITGLLTADSIVLNPATTPIYSSNSVVPKSYVDSLASGIILLSPSACATTPLTDTSTWIYNGTSQFTGVSTSLIIDGYTVQNGDRILVQNQSNQIQNGVYVYNQSSGILTRAMDLAYGSDASNVATFVQNGLVNKKTSFLQTNNGAITGQDNLVFTPLHTFDFTINNTLQFVGNTLGVNPNLTLTTLETTGNTNVDGELHVTGTSTLVGLVTTDNGLDVINGITTDTLDVTSSATLNSASINTTLDVTGNTNLSTVSTSGLATLNSVSVTSNETIGGTLGVTGNTNLSTLSTSGLATLNSVSVTGNESIGGTFNVTGNTTLSTVSTSGLASLNSVLVTGTTTLTGQLTANGGIQASTINTTNDSTFNGVKVGLGSGNVSSNTVVGNNALKNNTTGNNNVSIGIAALESNTTGYDNTAVGCDALQKYVSGSGGNSCLGFQSLYNNTGGTANTAMGKVSLQQSLSSFNTAFGFSSGVSLINGDNNTFLGASADVTNSATTYTQSTAIGYNSKITASNQIVLGTITENVVVPGTLGVIGNTSLSTVSTTGLATLNSLSVTGSATVGGSNIVTSSSLTTTLAGYAQLNSSPTFTGPVTSTNGFVSGSDYRIKENIAPLDSTFTVDNLNPVRFTNINTRKTDYGLVAHELQLVYPELVNGEKDGEQLQSVNYQGLIGILIQEIKNLKQEINELKEKVNI